MNSSTTTSRVPFLLLLAGCSLLGLETRLSMRKVKVLESTQSSPEVTINSSTSVKYLGQTCVYSQPITFALPDPLLRTVGSHRKAYQSTICRHSQVKRLHHLHRCPVLH